MSRSVADRRRVEVLEGAGVGLDPGGVHPRLVGEGVAADVGLVGVRRHVAELVEVVGGLGQSRELLGGDHLEAHLQLQRGQDRGQVGVAAALAVAVDRALHEPGAGSRPRRASWRPRTRRRCGCGCRPRRRRRAPPTTAAVASATWSGRLRAVGVAEGDVLGARLGGGAHALERVAGVVAVAVEEVLGVEDRPACPARGRRRPSRRSSPGSPRGRPWSPSPGAAPRSCRPGRPPGRRSSTSIAQRRSSSAAATPRRRVMPKAQIVACSSSSSASSSNSSASFGLELGKPASMNWTPSASSACTTLSFSPRRERHALAPMPSRKVVS